MNDLTANGIEIRRLHEDLLEPFYEFFKSIVDEGVEEFFSPHPFTRKQAQVICEYSGKDLYYCIINSAQIIGYGMLRGWDEGFAIPSVGLFIQPEFRTLGLGSLMLNFLHTAAKLRNASRVRIKVHRGNWRAKDLYDQFGYEFSENQGEFLVGFCEV